MLPLSILDLAFVPPGGTARDAFEASVALAQRAEQLGYTRVWYAEHHNIPTIASSATSVLIAHVAAHTQRIRLGSGGIMLPNHAPLVIAEQFGTLATLHPNRIDLGLGRAPGTDPTTLRALRVHPLDAEKFPDDVVELQDFLSDVSPLEGVEARPGQGTKVSLYILGSSLFGARLAAIMGLPFGFASHFAPDALEEAVAIYRREFQPSKQLEHPHVIAGVNVIASDSHDDAQQQLAQVRRSRVKALIGRGQNWTDAFADQVLASPSGQSIVAMGRYTAAGTRDEVRAFLESFALRAQADELITVHPSPTLAQRLRSVELLAEAWKLPAR